MNIYRLDPIDPNHLSWPLSAEMETVWACAPTETAARDLVADKTRQGMRVATGDCPLPKSPWQDAAVTSCVWEPSMTHVSVGTVVRADGSLVDD
jgi:hypothetical protein